MGKDPWFKFYPADWLADENVTAMTLTEEGAYARALAHCWLEGSIPCDDKSLSKLLKNARTKTVAVVRSRFINHPTLTGRLVNPRLSRERLNREEFSETQRNNAKRRWEGIPKQCQDDANGIASALPNTCLSNSESESEVRSIDRLDPAELVSGDKTSSSSSSVEYPLPERLARLVLYSLLEHDKSDVSHQSPVYLRAVEDARPFLQTHDVEEAKRYLKLIKEDVRHWWFDFIKDADFPVAYFASAFPKIKKHYDTKAPISKAQPNTKAAEKKNSTIALTSHFSKWIKKEENK